MANPYSYSWGTGDRDTGVRGVRFVEAPVRVSGDLVHWRGLMWSRAKARKRTKCDYSGKDIEPGALAYRPITNGLNRMRRVLASEWDRPPERP